MNTLYLDFETSSNTDIKKHGAPRHLADPAAKINCMSYAINGGPTDVIKHDYCTRAILVPLLVDLINSSERVVSHNALFEIAVLFYILGMPVHLPKWVCTAAKAAYHGYPRDLDGSAKALGCSSLKDIQGKAVMLMLAKNPLLTPQTNPEDFNRLYKYGAADIAPMREIDQKLPDLPPQIRAQWDLDAEINMRGVPIDVAAIQNAVKIVAQLEVLNDARMLEITLGKIASGRQPGELVKWVKTQGVEMVDCTADTVVKLLQKELPVNVIQALECRQVSSLTSLAKYQKMLDYQIAGRLYNMFMWCGAHTMRPTGAGPQLLNLTRGEDPMKWAQLLHDMPEFFTVIDKPDERLKEAIRGVISVA